MILNLQIYLNMIVFVYRRLLGLNIIFMLDLANLNCYQIYYCPTFLCYKHKIKSIIIFLMIDDKPLNNLELEKVSSRRSRKDEQGRDFQCGCGKRYLSYPALYTHIKTKHDGRQPEGTQKTGINLMSKRIRCKNQQQSHRTISNYVQKCDLKLLRQLDQNYNGSVPLSSRFKKQLLPKDVFECYNNLSKNQEINLSKTSTIDSALVVFLFGVGQCINEKLYSHYLLFTKLAKNCFIEHGEQVFKACFNKKQGFRVIQQFVTAQVQYFPIICDFLMRHYIPYSQATRQIENINLSLMELVLSDFCDWLYKKHLTFIKVSLKKEYRLQIKTNQSQEKKNVVNNNDASKNIQEAQDGSFFESSIKNESLQQNYQEINEHILPNEQKMCEADQEKQQAKANDFEYSLPDKQMEDENQKKGSEVFKSI